ncbi:MAG: carboxypeptidase regulatory-like domain-containing protein [Planctomycetes bacterium]|nr:carboxypeptidase regulatory-like domain-containing protein [Planctomycetota bacterium]
MQGRVAHGVDAIDDAPAADLVRGRTNCRFQEVMRRLALLLLLAMGALLAWLGYASTAEPELPPAPAAATIDSDQAADAQEEDADVAFARSAPAETDEDAVPGEVAERREVLVAPTQRPPVVVTVVQGNPRRPVAKARVHWVHEASGWQRHERKPHGSTHVWDLPGMFGTSASTDDAGTVTIVPAADDGSDLLVTCQHEGRFGAVRIQGDRASATLRLFGDHTLTFTTHSHDNRPVAGVPLLIAQGEGFGRAEDLVRLTSDQKGHAQLRHAQLFLSRRVKLSCVAVAAPMPEPVGALIPRPFPTDPIALQVPALAQVDLRLVDTLDQPILADAWLSVRAARPRDFKLPWPLNADFERLLASKPPGSAPMRLGPVGVGTTLVAAARIGELRNVRGEPFAGPTTAEDIVNHALRLPTDALVLTGRLLRPDGSPGGGLEVPFAIRSEQGRIAGGRINPLDDGRFDVVVRFAAATATMFEARLQRPDGEQEGAERPLPVLMPGTRYDLGELRLVLEPMLVQGQVVDDRGQPVADASLRVQTLLPESRREAWRDAPFRTDSTDGEGRFRLHGSPPPGTQRLRAGKEGHFPTAIPLVAVGGTVRLVLPRAGVLHGTARLPDWLHDEVASIQLRSLDDPERRPVGTALRQGKNAAFAIENLQPGLWDATVHLRNLQQPVLQLGSLMIAPDDNRDPRCEPIDLTTAVFRYRLRAIDPRGQTLPIDGPILARLQQRDGSRQDTGFRWQRGKAELITTSALVDLVAFARGYPPTALTLGPGDHDVPMQALPPVAISVPGLRSIVGPERRVRISMILEGDTGFPQSLSGVDQRSGESFSFPRWELGKSNGGWLPAYDVAEVLLARSGRYEVVARIYQGSSEEGTQRSLPLGHVDVVLEGGMARAFTLSFDQAAAQAIVAAFANLAAPNRSRRGQPRGR